MWRGCALFLDRPSDSGPCASVSFVSQLFRCWMCQLQKAFFLRGTMCLASQFLPMLQPNRWESPSNNEGEHGSLRPDVWKTALLFILIDPSHHWGAACSKMPSGTRFSSHSAPTWIWARCLLGWPALVLLSITVFLFFLKTKKQSLFPAQSVSRVR